MAKIGFPREEDISEGNWRMKEDRILLDCSEEQPPKLRKVLIELCLGQESFLKYSSNFSLSEETQVFLFLCSSRPTEMYSGINRFTDGN